jgi:hypothetical protein
MKQLLNGAVQEMEEGPPEPPYRGRLQTTASCVGKERGGERMRKRRGKTSSGEIQEGECKRTTDDASKPLMTTSKPRSFGNLGTSLEGAC